jgi:hypothetical protein
MTSVSCNLPRETYLTWSCPVLPLAERASHYSDRLGYIILALQIFHYACTDPNLCGFGPGVSLLFGPGRILLKSASS